MSLCMSCVENVRSLFTAILRDQVCVCAQERGGEREGEGGRGGREIEGERDGVKHFSTLIVVDVQW